MSIETSSRTVRGLTLFILSTAVLATFGPGMLSPLMPALTERYGGTALTIGLLFASQSMARFIVSPAMGALSDRYGRRPIMLFSLLGMASGYFIFGIGGALWVLFAGLIVVGAADINPGLAYSYIADTTDPRRRTRAFSFIGVAMGFGFIFGSVVSSLFSPVNPVVPVYILAAVIFAISIWGYFAMPESLPKSSRILQLKLHQLNLLAQFYSIMKLPHLRWLLLSFLFTWMTVMVSATNLPLLITEYLNWTSERVSVLFAFYGVLNVLVLAFVLPRLLRIFTEVHLAIGGALLAGLSFLGLGMLPSTKSIVLLYGAIVLFSIGQPIAETALCGAISKSVGPSEQGRIQGSINAVQALAQMLGPLLAGWLYEAVSPAMPYWVGGVQMLIGGLVVFLAIPKLRVAE